MQKISFPNAKKHVRDFVFVSLNKVMEANYALKTLNEIITCLFVEGWTNTSSPCGLGNGHRAEQRHRHFESCHTARSARRHQRRGTQVLFGSFVAT